MDGVIEVGTIEKILAEWKQAWPHAREIWSSYVKLREPVWCITSSEAEKEGLTGSFAMIRLTDHRIVIDLEKVMKFEVQPYALQVLAHEIGHHVYSPANLHDNAVLLNRIRWSLAGIENRTGFVSNIYADFLINDMLQRTKNLDMASVYKKMNAGIVFSETWTLIMRTYEYLWKLKRGELATDLKLHSPKMDADASLMASLVRSYSKRWMEGGGRFAALMYPYLIEDEEYQKSRQSMVLILDAEYAGEDGGIITGLAEIDEESRAGAVDPREETADAEKKKEDAKKSSPLGLGKNLKGGNGPKQRYLHPGHYIDLFKQINPNANEQDLINSYYREIALPHLISFPMEISAATGSSTPEGTDTWDIGDSIEEIDWLESAIASPQVVPGYSTLKRLHGPDSDSATSKKPLDVYIGIDCSGSMTNPRNGFSWPVLAATVIGLSALRAGAKVMGCLSGEPGSYLETNGFSTTEREILTTITSYLGTGYAYGVPRLKTPFKDKRKEKAHIVLVTDDDIFSMLGANDTKENNWDIIEYALHNAGGTGTLVLHSQQEWHKEEVKRLVAMGWRIHYVTDEAGLLDFAAEFSQMNYHKANRR